MHWSQGAWIKELPPLKRTFGSNVPLICYMHFPHWRIGTIFSLLNSEPLSPTTPDYVQLISKRKIIVTASIILLSDYKLMGFETISTVWLLVSSPLPGQLLTLALWLHLHNYFWEFLGCWFPTTPFLLLYMILIFAAIDPRPKRFVLCITYLNRRKINDNKFENCINDRVLLTIHGV